MKKLIKLFSLSFLSLIMVLILAVPVSAQEIQSNNNEVVVEYFFGEHFIDETLVDDFKITPRSGPMGYSSWVPSQSGLWIFQFKKEYKITPKKTDVYKYGVYQYSFMTYKYEHSWDHRWIKA